MVGNDFHAGVPFVKLQSLIEARDKLLQGLPMAGA